MGAIRQSTDYASTYGAYLKLRDYAKDVVDAFTEVHGFLAPHAQRHRGMTPAQEKRATETAELCSIPVSLNEGWRVLPNQRWASLLITKCGSSESTVFRAEIGSNRPPLFPASWKPPVPERWISSTWDDRYEVSEYLTLRRKDRTPVGIMPLCRYFDIAGISRSVGLAAVVMGNGRNSAFAPTPGSEYYWGRLNSDICVSGEYLNHGPVMLTALPLNNRELTAPRLLYSVLGARVFIRDEIGLMMYDVACPPVYSRIRRPVDRDGDPNGPAIPSLYMLMAMPEASSPMAIAGKHPRDKRNWDRWRSMSVLFDSSTLDAWENAGANDVKDTALAVQMKANRRYSALLHYARKEQRASYLSPLLERSKGYVQTKEYQATEEVLKAYNSSLMSGETTLKRRKAAGGQFEFLSAPMDLAGALAKLKGIVGKKESVNALNADIVQQEWMNRVISEWAILGVDEFPEPLF